MNLHIFSMNNENLINKFNLENNILIYKHTNKCEHLLNYKKHTSMYNTFRSIITLIYGWYINKLHDILSFTVINN